MHTYSEGCMEEQNVACFCEECEESTDCGGKRTEVEKKKAKTERQHDSAIFLLLAL